MSTDGNPISLVAYVSALPGLAVLIVLSGIGLELCVSGFIGQVLRIYLVFLPFGF